MVCQSCGTENRPGRRFCVECGTALAATCPSCSAAVEPDEKFCGTCGTRLAEAATLAGPAAPIAPVSERRLVSVLFADLVGFTTYAEGRDSEETRGLLSRYFDLCRDVIGRYGGTVEKFIGDAVMAVWGAPVAREDDAERAVRAGLELVDAVLGLGPSIQARAGVLTGEAAMPGPRTRTASTSSSPARTARSASSSRATGVPHTAMTASPMNFSTLPP